tara:strand:+ start:1851 stop:4100 length:2250 start_codon:yes stop_codon:yes gene_type:complete
MDNGRLTSVEPFEKDGHSSDLLQSIPDAVYDTSRIQAPMVRKGWLKPGREPHGRGRDAFIQVSWREALDLVAGELQLVKDTFGNEAIFGGSYGWASAGRFHHANTQLKRFLNCHGGFVNQLHTYSIAAGLTLLPRILGDHRALRALTPWSEIRNHTQLFVAFGGLGTKNAQVLSGGPGEHVLGDWLPALARAGVEVVSVSPVRDDTVDALNAEWLAPRPNTDTALMLGLAHTLVEEGLHDRAFLNRYCVGFERFERYLMGRDCGVPKSADWASNICEVPAETIRALARRMASARTMIGTAWSLQRAEHGEQPFWMTVVLGAMLGQVGLPGGGFGFGYASTNGPGNTIHKVPVPNLTSGDNPVRNHIPVARIADMLLHPGEPYDFDGESRTYPDIRLVYWCGGNPFHHHQDINRLIAAWRRPQTVIVQDPWWTATARHADIVLPATTTLERNDIGASSDDRFILAMEKAIDPVGEARNDYDIFSDLAARFGYIDSFTEGRDESEWLFHLYEVARQKSAKEGIALPDFDSFWKAGHAEKPVRTEPYNLYADFRADPNACSLKTPSGKIEIFSETIDNFGYDDCPGHPVWLEPSEWLGGDMAKRHPLHLISSQPNGRLHSQMDQGRVSRVTKIKGREPIRLHPLDAADRGIVAGDIVRVFNDRGAVLAGVILSEELRRGVVQLATGAWYDPLSTEEPNTLDKHGNPNVLTIDRGTSKLGQGPVSHTTLVEVEIYSEPLPAITAFDRPKPVAR